MIISDIYIFLLHCRFTVAEWIDCKLCIVCAQRLPACVPVWPHSTSPRLCALGCVYVCDSCRVRRSSTRPAAAAAAAAAAAPRQPLLRSFRSAKTKQKRKTPPSQNPPAALKVEAGCCGLPIVCEFPSDDVCSPYNRVNRSRFRCCNCFRSNAK